MHSIRHSQLNGDQATADDVRIAGELGLLLDKKLLAQARDFLLP